MQKAETEELIGKLFDGSPDLLFASLLGRQALTGAQIEALRQIAAEMERES